ncbi:hypothetical protein MMC28_003609 [Mycoblastus sanguinarius]|nr:hypothetical protein [Mycoblastus sanguinarius]
MAEIPTRICVFCSTTSGNSAAHLDAARSLAVTMHAHGIKLVYGGGTTGMMGELAKTLVALSGPDSVHGIIPKAYLSIERPDGPGNKAEEEEEEEEKKSQVVRFMLWCKRSIGGVENRNKAKSSLLSEDVYGRTTVVGDVQIRKKMMAREVAKGGKGSGFIGLSGGFGTMDELMEMVTWNQLGLHERGICVYNVDGFWDGVLSWMDHAIEAGFVREEGRKLFAAKETAEECVQYLRVYKAERGFDINMETSP